MDESRQTERTAAIARARAESSPQAIIDGVKEIVATEIRDLSPDAKVIATSFYNHTYMPDFMMEWREHGRTTTRPVFIRNYVTSNVAEREVDALSSQEPVLVGLDPIETDDAPAIRDSSSHSRMLFSDIASIDSLGQAGSDDGVNPLLALVRSNVLRGGRGLLGEAEVATVSAASDLDLNAEDAGPKLERFSEMAASMFEEAAATRLLRAADIIRLASLDSDEPFIAAIQGELADTDLRILLPYLLLQDNGEDNSYFWQYVGSMMNLARLEEFAGALEGVSVEPLVKANLENWTAKRARLSLNSLFDEDKDDGRTAKWGMQEGVLTGSVGRYLLAIASSGRKLKTREDSLLPTWGDIDNIADRYRLDQVNLRGIVRRVRVSAEESGDVASDVRQINSTLEDSYNLDVIAVKRVGSSAETSMRVDFSTWLVTADEFEPIQDLAETALDFLAYRNPVELDRKATLLGSAETTSDSGPADA